LCQWLAEHDLKLDRFMDLVPISTVATETGLSVDAIRETISTSQIPVYHIWSHTYQGKTRPSKPYCLRVGGPDAICLDWEDSVVAAAEADFRLRGYDTCRELGTDEHIQCLIGKPDLKQMTPGVNLRDLWALRLDGDCIDLWIIEAKGKEAGGFSRYCFAEALSQLFEISAELLSTLLGSRRRASHGLCYRFANQFVSGWKERGRQATVTIAVLIPLWNSDAIWNGVAKTRYRAYYQQPFDELVEFVGKGSSRATSARKIEATFGRILEELESNYAIRKMAHAGTEIRFRVLTACSEPTTGEFMLNCFPMDRSE
jgi:hypothetical protein